MKKAESAANHMTEEIMTVSSLALYLRCNQSTIYRLLKKKQIPAFNLGSDWRFFRSAIDDWIAQHEITNPPVTRGSVPSVAAARRKRGHKPKLS